MVMRPEPLFAAVEPLRVPGATVILLDPAGEPLTDRLARDLATAGRLVLVCGRYEGIDERARALVDREVSIGDYVLTGGELPALVLIDAIGTARSRRHRGRVARGRLLRGRPAGGAAVHTPRTVPRRLRPARAPLRAPRRGRPLAPRGGPATHAPPPPGPARRRSIDRCGPRRSWTTCGRSAD